MAQNLSSAAVVIGALRVNTLPELAVFGAHSIRVNQDLNCTLAVKHLINARQLL